MHEMSTILNLMEEQLCIILAHESLPKAEEAHSLAVEDAFDAAVKAPSSSESKLIGAIFATVAGIIRQCKGRELAKLTTKIREGLQHQIVGHIFARSIEIIFGPYPSLTKEYHAQIKPLWRQKAYFEIIKPMLLEAWPKTASDPQQTLAVANHSIAVLSAVKHLAYQIYEDDTEDLVRLILCSLQYLPVGQDAEAGLKILKEITNEAPHRIKPFLKSVVDTCMAILSGISVSKEAETRWLPTGYSRPGHLQELDASCRSLAIELLGQLPKKYEAGEILGSAPRVRRILAQTSGDRVREVRKMALMARATWIDVK
jgi:DNA repair/transcription protein MET18/MMS19